MVFHGWCMGFDDIYRLLECGNLRHESDLEDRSRKDGNLKGIRRDSIWCVCSGDCCGAGLDRGSSAAGPLRSRPEASRPVAGLYSAGMPR
jgi:hypothetical protein